METNCYGYEYQKSGKVMVECAANVLYLTWLLQQSQIHPFGFIFLSLSLSSIMFVTITCTLYKVLHLH